MNTETTVAIIGLGLIGGSFAKDLRSSQKFSHFIGVDTNPAHCEQALDLQLVDKILPLDAALKIADLIVLAIPVNSARQLLPTVLTHVDRQQVVMDMGSTKAGICESVADHPKRAHFVATHPIAGTENSGPSAAIEGLYNGKLTILCNLEQSAPFAVEQVRSCYQNIGMRSIEMNAIEHDRHIAYVSHLSHISSFTLGLTVLDIEKDEKNIFNMAGSGFASTVRLAKSSPAMWGPIFEQNADHLLGALDAYINHLQGFRAAIEQRDLETLQDKMETANSIRSILDGTSPS